jgi:hypothetical protein
MYNAFEGLATSSAWPRQHEFSQVTNNEASVFHEQTLIRAKMVSPHDRLPISRDDSTPRSRSSGRQLSIPMGRLRHACCGHDTTCTPWWPCALFYHHPLSRSFRCDLSMDRRSVHPRPRRILHLLASWNPPYGKFWPIGNVKCCHEREAPARDAVVHLQLATIPLVVTLAVVVIGRRTVQLRAVCLL